MSHAGDYLRYFCSHGEIYDIRDSNILERGLAGFIKYWVISNSFLCRNSSRNEPQSDYVVMGREIHLPLTHPLTSPTIWEPSCYHAVFSVPTQAFGMPLLFHFSFQKWKFAWVQLGVQGFWSWDNCLPSLSKFFRQLSCGTDSSWTSWCRVAEGKSRAVLWNPLTFQVGSVSSRVCLHVRMDFGSCQVRAKAANAGNK